MDHTSPTAALLLAHARRYDQLQIQDVLKFLHQSAFGCEHMVTDLEAVTAYLVREAQSLQSAPADPVESLDGDFARVHLSVLLSGLSPETLGKLFYLSAREPAPGKAALEKQLDIAQRLVNEGLLPFHPNDFADARARWQAQGYPALHHSETFRSCYHPAYRVIARRYLPFLPLLAKLDSMLSQKPVLLAIEGGSASGKTTLADLLQQLYGCTVAHMDDFFLRPEQRTPARFAQPGGNVDHERFLEQVLLPFSRGGGALYRPFDCSTGTISQGEWLEPTRLTVVEGAYAMHPSLEAYYQLSVFLDIDPQLQLTRLQKRNSPAMVRRFLEEWIPLERLYFTHTGVCSRCDLTIPIV